MSGQRESRPQEFQGTARFEILRRLGAGGMGVVYEAIDRESGQHIALKTLRSLSADGLFRFKNEFRALQDIHHPNLIRLGELFEDAGQWFFTMELILGVHFLAWVREDKRPGYKAPEPAAEEESSTIDVTIDSDMRPDVELKGVDLPRLRAAAADLARGVNALHAAGKVHRDIKPSNLLVTDEGRVVILDFGLITDAHQGDFEKRFVGTVGYMAPEQTEMKNVGPEADWYSVGVVMYQALTGRLPLVGTMQEVVAMKRTFEPAPPRLIMPGVPADLDKLCMQLLSIEASARPKGREILSRLDAEDELDTGPIAGGGHFVGRVRELMALKTAFAEARCGQAITMLIHGESGVGKSALTRRFADSLEVEKRGAVVFSGRCYERESVPFKAVDGVIDSLSRYLSTVESSHLLPRQRGLLGQVFPVMRRVRAIAEAPLHGLEGLDPLILRARLFAALRELFTKIARAVPLVVIVDDLQWADPDSLAMLAAILRPPDAPNLLFVATMRSAAETEFGVRSVAAIRPELVGDVRVMPLEPLTRSGAQTLVAMLLRESGADISQSTDTIADEAGGHPLFIDELVRRRITLGESGTPLRLDDALWQRIGRLDDGARIVLELIAVAGAPIVQEVASAAAGVDFGSFAEQVTKLRGAHLVRTTGARRTDSVEPYHDRVREAVLAHLDAGVKQACHERLALALEASGSADAESLATHWRGANHAEKAFEHTRAAADQAVDALAFDRAARLYQLALALRPDGGSVGKAVLLRRLADALVNAGRGADAAKAYLETATLVGAAEGLDLRRRAAQQLLFSGHVDEAQRTIKTVLDDIKMDLPTSQRAALAALMFRRAQTRLRGLGFKQRDAKDITPQDLLRIDTCWGVGVGLGLIDTIVGSYFQTRGLLLALEAGEPARVVRSLAGEVCFNSASGGRSRDRTAALLKTTRELAEKHGEVYGLAWAHGANGVSATLEGRWKTGHEGCDKAEAIFRDKCTGVAFELSTMRWFALWSIAYLGQLKELATRVPTRLREARERGDLYGEIANATGLQNLVWLMEDKPSEARERSQEAMRKWSQKKFHVEHWWAMLADRQIDLYEGRGGDALKAIGQQWPALDGSLLLMCQLTEIEALHLRARAAIAASSERGQNKADLLSLAEKDAKKILSEKMPWADPLATLLAAAIAAARGDAAMSITGLQRAASGFDDADMALYAIAARFRLGQMQGGDKGRALRDTAHDWLKDQGVRDPHKMVAMLAPGFTT